MVLSTLRNLVFQLTDLEYSKMPLEEKRKHYDCGEDYVTISSVPTWSEFHKSKSPTC